jgi:hypothetical protein
VTDEIADPTGMASTRLAEAVGYPGSSVAFAQLLSGMERDSLIAREVRGKRTYRITLADGAAARSGLDQPGGGAGSRARDGHPAGAARGLRFRRPHRAGRRRQAAALRARNGPG